MQKPNVYICLFVQISDNSEAGFAVTECVCV